MEKRVSNTQAVNTEQQGLKYSRVQIFRVEFTRLICGYFREHFTRQYENNIFSSFYREMLVYQLGKCQTNKGAKTSVRCEREEASELFFEVVAVGRGRLKMIVVLVLLDKSQKHVYMEILRNSSSNFLNDENFILGKNLKKISKQT